jgi:hydrogenase maturation factor HypF (carbamoyltransferase family)
MLNWLFGKPLQQHIDETKKIKVNGVRFEIKKINTLNYLEGAKVLKQSYDVYKTKGQEASVAVNDKKVQEHFAHVLCSAVVHPKLSLKDDGTGIFVEKLFVDWEMVVGLYNEIMAFTYGKKKMKQLL